MRTKPFSGVIAFLIVFFPGLALADDNARLANKTLVEIQQALDLFKQRTRPHEDLLTTTKAEVVTDKGIEPIGQVWDEALVSAGLPASYQDRAAIVKQLNLDDQAGFALVGAASAESIRNLLDRLGAIAATH